ncbi:MAG: diphosphate--fructose-6-phosphate 1-phosphotransferase, partial [bacterium]
VIGIPKTIDNDLPVTDHCPGYGSAAKYIANACMEIACDSSAYPKGKVTIAEIMGRHTGWLTAASYVATATKFGPDLIYLPEIPFSTEQFKEDIRRVMQKKDHCLVAVSEGIHDVFGNFIAASSGSKDAFGHTQLGGVCHKLASIVSDELGYSTRPCELSLLQRSAAHLQSGSDVKEAINVGRYGVRYALAGKTSVMVCMRRRPGEKYAIQYFTHSLKDVAAVEKTVPRAMINEAGNFINPEFLAYVLPLIEGQNKPKFKDGVMQFTSILKP